MNPFKSEASALKLPSRWPVRRVWFVALAAMVLACSRDEPATPVPPGGLAQELLLAGAPIMIGAGDIAVCGTKADEATARIVDSLLTTPGAAIVQSFVFTLGDNAYPSGSGGANDYFRRCFSPSWGATRIMNRIHPAPGNHDYDTGSGAPYFDYFGDRAGPAGKGFYSYEAGNWHVISLNSELYFSRATPAEALEQEAWLRKDLSDHRNLCTLAYFHRPLFSSGVHGGTPQMLPLWRILSDGGVDLILGGHDHHYERFLPQTPAGVADSAKGIAQIIIGTGGARLRGERARLAPNSALRIRGRYGVLKLT
ncbi:MAG TPA: metallophosphoesterase, partial [Gemmatimonadaceae bacterium]|nr:metallophosphoesterase [Gemmatimonadaceae bacterium]